MSHEREVVNAVLYAMKVGCFFPVPEPDPSEPLEAWLQWGALRNLHAAVARLSRAA